MEIVSLKTGVTRQNRGPTDGGKDNGSVKCHLVREVE